MRGNEKRRGAGERTGGGMSVRQPQQLPVSHRSGGSSGWQTKKISFINKPQRFPNLVSCELVIQYIKKQAYERMSGNKVRLTC